MASGGERKSKSQTQRVGRKAPSLLDPVPLPSSRLRRTTQQGSPSRNRPAQPASSPTPPRVASTARPKLLTLSAVAIFAFSTYGSYLYVTYQNAIEESRSLSVPLDVSDRYDKTAANYDTEVNTSEWMMGLGKKRKELVERARGNVLEVSCGTGRNMEYYQLGERRGTDKKGKAKIQGCRSVTFVDLSGEMVEVAREKFEKAFKEAREEENKGKNISKIVAFRTQDAMEPIQPAELAAKGWAATAKGKGAKEGEGEMKFDTVIQTMGLCSHPDPVRFLKRMGDITEPENGRILLLEHGRSYYGWVNRLLDELAPAHADRHGCWWNRDIGEIVEKSGLEVEETRRWHLGTTWLYILRPGRKGDPSAAAKM